MMLRTVSGEQHGAGSPQGTVGQFTLPQSFAASIGFATANKQSKKVCPD